MSRQAVPGRDQVLEGARVVGRGVHPNLEVALAGVRGRAAQRADRARRGRRVLATVALGCAVLAAAPVLASRGEPAAGPAGATPVAAVHQAIQPPPVLQPAVAFSRARVAPAGVGAPTADGTGAAACPVAGVSLEMAMDQDVYVPGQPVAVDLVLRNTTATACGVPLDPCRSGITVTAADGAVAYASGADTSWLCSAVPSEVALAPGGIARLTFTWSPLTCSSLPVPCAPPGRYRVDGAWAGSDFLALPRHMVISAGRVS